MLTLRLDECDENTEPHIRRNGGEVNIVVENEHLQEGDIELFFGPIQPFDTTILVPEGTSWAHVLAKIGCFPSVSQARKNGWNKPIQPGWTDRFKVGKAARKFFWVLNPLKSEDEEAEE